jgi:hypothetical protein
MLSGQTASFLASHTNPLREGAQLAISWRFASNIAPSIPTGWNTWNTVLGQKFRLGKGALLRTICNWDSAIFMPDLKAVF